jgi:hypothetical protein
MHYPYRVCFVCEALLSNFSLGEIIRMKRFTAVALVVIFLASFSVAQDQAVMKEFTRSGYMSGMKLSFVLLIDKTIDIFFPESSRNTVKAKADSGTTFFILGTTDKNIKLKTKFVIEQDGDKFSGTVTNIKNFQDGELAKGEKVNGLLQLDKKLNLNHSFTIKGADGILDFKLTDIGLRMLPN